MCEITDIPREIGFGEFFMVSIFFSTRSPPFSARGKLSTFYFIVARFGNLRCIRIQMYHNVMFPASVCVCGFGEIDFEIYSMFEVFQKFIQFHHMQFPHGIFSLSVLRPPMINANCWFHSIPIHWQEPCIYTMPSNGILLGAPCAPKKTPHRMNLCEMFCTYRLKGLAKKRAQWNSVSAPQSIVKATGTKRLCKQ